MTDRVDSFRYLDFINRKLVQHWAAAPPPADIPWTPLARPLAGCTVALLSTAAVVYRGDPPFDEEGERRDPWWGDPSYRVIPAHATEADVSFHHLHVDPTPAQEDLDVVLPLRRLAEAQAAGRIGRVAPSHYSIMGYILQPDELLGTSAPAIAAGLRNEEVDVALLVPV